MNQLSNFHQDQQCNDKTSNITNIIVISVTILLVGAIQIYSYYIKRKLRKQLTNTQYNSLILKSSNCFEQGMIKSDNTAFRQRSSESIRNQESSLKGSKRYSKYN